MAINGKSTNGNKPTFTSGDRIRQSLGEDFVNDVETSALNRVEASGFAAAAVRADCPTTVMNDEGNKNSMNAKEALKNIIHTNETIGTNTETYATYAKKIGLSESAVRNRNGNLVSSYNKLYPPFTNRFPEFKILGKSMTSFYRTVYHEYYNDDPHSKNKYNSAFIWVPQSWLLGAKLGVVGGIGLGMTFDAVLENDPAKFIKRVCLSAGFSFAASYMFAYDRERFVDLWDTTKYSKSEINDINLTAKVETVKYSVRSTLLTNILPILATKAIMKNVVKDVGKYTDIVEDGILIGTKIAGNIANGFIQNKIATKQRNNLQMAIDNHCPDVHKLAAKAMVNSAIASSIPANTLMDYMAVSVVLADAGKLAIDHFKTSKEAKLQNIVKTNTEVVKKMPVKVVSNNKSATKKVASN